LLPAHQVPPAHYDSALSSTKDILVVSDDETLSAAVAACLQEEAGCKVDCTAFGETALERYRLSPYRLIVVDLPEHNLDEDCFHDLVCALSAAPCEGAQAATTGRQEPLLGQAAGRHANRADRPAFLLLSETAGDETNGQAFLHEQLIAALAKPLHRDQLLEMVDDLLDLQQSLRAERFEYVAQ